MKSTTIKKFGNFMGTVLIILIAIIAIGLCIAFILLIYGWIIDMIGGLHV